MHQSPLVTVLITTYNQEKYICRAIDSVLAQKTDFPFEIYISEDCGTDGTRAILQQYAVKHPQIIRLHLREQNVGISCNWYQGLLAAKGEFVCTLEGDDWWRSETKLQTQVDFLRTHPDYVAVSHTILLTDNLGNTYGCLPNDERILGKQATMALFLQGVTYSCTACLARNIFKGAPPAWQAYVTANRSIADFALCMLYLDAGRVFVLDQPLSAYRVAGENATHTNYNATQSAVKKYSDFLDVVLASNVFWGGKYTFNGCLLAGSFYPLIDRFKFGGLPPFLRQMGRLPLGVKLALPFYCAGRLAGLAARRLRRKP